MKFRCIKCSSYGGFGSFSKKSYDYLFNKYGKELANNILKTEEGLTTWNPETMERESIYFPAGGKDKARFNKYFIEVVEQGLEPSYYVAEGHIDIDSIDGLDTTVKITF